MEPNLALPAAFLLVEAEQVQNSQPSDNVVWMIVGLALGGALILSAAFLYMRSKSRKQM